MEYVIEVNNLVKNYGSVRAVDSISFSVRKGEIFTLIGPNGAGKTTTIEILECLRKPTSGEARVFGYDVKKDEDKIKKVIGVVPQEFSSFDNLTVLENVRLIADIYGKKDRLKEYLEIFNLWEIRNKRFKTLSGGMKKRVAICMALVSDPEIIFLDEPTTGLDPEARREIWKLIKKLKESGKTIFLTTHYMEEAEKLSDTVCVIIGGKIVAKDSVVELLKKHGGDHKVLVRHRNDVALEVLRKHASYVKILEDSVIGFFPTRKEAAMALMNLYSMDIDAELISPTMEDVFIRLIGRRINERGEIE